MVVRSKMKSNYRIYTNDKVEKNKIENVHYFDERIAIYHCKKGQRMPCNDFKAASKTPVGLSVYSYIYWQNILYPYL